MAATAIEQQAAAGGRDASSSEVARPLKPHDQTVGCVGRDHHGDLSCVRSPVRSRSEPAHRRIRAPSAETRRGCGRGTPLAARRAPPGPRAGSDGRSRRCSRRAAPQIGLVERHLCDLLGTPWPSPLAAVEPPKPAVVAAKIARQPWRGRMDPQVDPRVAQRMATGVFDCVRERPQSRCLVMKQARESAKRRQARAARRQVEAKCRKAQRDRQKPNIARVPAPHNSTASADASFTPTFQSVLSAMKDFLAGAGRVAANLRSWSPPATARDPLELEVHIQLFGLTLIANGAIYPITRADFTAPESDENGDWDWWQATPPRLVLDMLIQDQRAATAVIVADAILIFLEEDFLPCDQDVVRQVLARLGVTELLEVNLDGLARQLPEPERRRWYRAQREGLFGENFGDAIQDSIEIELSGSLVEFAEALDERALGRLPARPRPWRPGGARELLGFELVGKGAWDHDAMLAQLRAKADAASVVTGPNKIHIGKGPRKQLVAYCRGEGLEVVAVGLVSGPLLRVDGVDMWSLLDRAVRGEEQAMGELRSRYTDPQLDVVMHVYERFNECQKNPDEAYMW